MVEDRDYLSKQILTYIGNKRALLEFIQKYVLKVKKELGKEKLVSADVFSGSGIVARMLKQFSSIIYANDLENYSKIINECFLTNKEDIDVQEFNSVLNKINKKIKEKPIEGIITKLYSPKDDNNIKEGERVFYTHSNAIYIDSFRHYIDECSPDKFKNIFLALLIIEASIHVNTCGVFKGFYKDNDTGIGKFGGSGENALSRIKGEIKIERPVLSNFSCESKVFQEDAVVLSKNLKNVDLVYLDPPYNQHPYGSNYFMLNLIIDNKEPEEISKVSGIVKGWNHSDFNKKATALKSMEEIISNFDAKYFLISYNNEGFISFNEMESMLKKYGKVQTEAIKYNTFRGSHNLNIRDIHTNEYLFLLKKE